MKGVAAVLATVALLVCAQAGPAAPGLQHVTFIGDSVADGIAGDATARSMVSQGIDLDLETAACRRVDDVGCPVNGSRPTSAVQVAQSLGAGIGPYVVVSVGYNDLEDQYAGNVENALAAFAADGVKHVWWLTLRAAHHGYITMNDDIEAAAAHHPELSVIDWNAYSRNHPEWFQADGIHLIWSGSEAMAQLIHDTLRNAGVALPSVHITTAMLPLARPGKSYAVRLRAAGGDAPLRWSLLARAPKGIHLLSSGRLEGDPRVPRGRYSLRVQVKDAQGFAETRILTLRVS